MSDSSAKPLNIAVALQFDGKNAPKVSATGNGLIADKIVEIAEEHDIPLQENPELAAVLAQVPLGDEIPNELYSAVAEVIAFAHYLSGKTLPKTHDL